MKKVYYICILACLLFSCAKHEEVINTDFQIGNILCADGRVLHPTLFNKNKDSAVGVVFWTNPGDPKIKDMGYAVALEDLGNCILIDSFENISSVTEDEKAFDGAANTAAILNFGITKEIDTPAATKASEYIPNGLSGWFIPSAAQAKALSLSIIKVNSTLDFLGATHCSGWYWTATEDGTGKETPNMYALISSISEGRISVANKKSSNKLRLIIAIK